MPHTADLHTHTVHSDGTDTVAGLLAAARAAGLSTVALTDHDTAAGWDEAAGLVPPGMRVLPGAEFSTKFQTPGGELVSVHLLGYLFDRDDPAVAAEWARMRDERASRGTRIVEALVAAGFPITLGQVRGHAGPSSIGRPHIARALMDAGVVSSVGEETGVVLSGSVGSGSAVSGGSVSGKVGSGTVVPVPVELSGDSGEVSLLPGLVSV